MKIPPVNIFAFTPPGANPPYISVNEGADGAVSITVRSALTSVTAEIELSVTEARSLGESLVAATKGK